MQKTKQNLFEGFVKMGMPPTAEMGDIIEKDIDMAAKVFRHCSRRFCGGGKRVDSPTGYVVACLRNPSKFGITRVEGRLQGPEDADELTAEARHKAESARKVASKDLLAKTQADAEKAYADMAVVWESLPLEAKTEIREFVSKSSPLFHQSGEDEVEFELQCMREATKFGRMSWLKKQLGKQSQKTTG